MLVALVRLGSFLAVRWNFDGTLSSVLSQKFAALKYESLELQVLCLQHRKSETYSTNLQFRTLV